VRGIPSLDTVMSSYRLDQLFAPRGIAVIGASPRPDSVGRAVLRNLRDGGFAGELSVVNPNHASVEDLPAVDTVAALPQAPDLVVIATPPALVPLARPPCDRMPGSWG
jgi:acetyltransferase